MPATSVDVPRKQNPLPPRVKKSDVKSKVTMTPDLDTELQPGEEKSKPQRPSPPEKHPGEEKSKGQRPSPPEKSDTKETDQVFDKDEEKNLKQFDFYHGFLPREDLYILVKYVGDYLLRVSEVDNDPTKIRREIILSVSIEHERKKGKEVKEVKEKENDMVTAISASPPKRNKGKLKNVIVRRRSNKYLVETNRLFDTLKDLMMYYQNHYGRLKKFKFTLTNPIKQQPWEFLHSDVKQGTLLGQGAFGEVRAGTLKLKTGENVDVAIKVTKGSSDLCKAKIKEMMKEARLMRNFQHKNIVRIYGVAVDEQPLYIILELVTGGALNTFLKANAGKVGVMDKTAMCLGAARGAEYLHLHHCMHRDLAARNCLITRDRIVKISDFGLSRMGTQYQLRTSMRLPIKWLAPETISTFLFSLKTDVFSFGVVVYEIFSDGGEPWQGKTNAEVKACVTNGRYLALPECVPEALQTFIYERVFVMDPAERADMTEVVKEFEQFLIDNAPAENVWWWRPRRKVQRRKKESAIRSVMASLKFSQK
uniref:Tyrosine-protein kinase n=1 Tax=Haemonchus contortus TaxID=6289 RepID=A0A7I4YLF9_HAECO